MNEELRNDELRFSSAVRQALDESTERLPLQITHRLEQARTAALARLPESAGHPVRAERPVRHAGSPDTGNGERHRGRAAASYLAVVRALRLGRERQSPVPEFAPKGKASRLVWRLAVVALPLTVVVAGVIGFSELAAERSAHEVAELEAEVLTDEVPISAYADRGFGAYLKTSYQPEQ